ncbi:MAG TPA: RidA family protein [Vicinamibacterales bacterium]|nr:RidA family protein [Vicinamibacterales bacterium]
MKGSILTVTAVLAMSGVAMQGQGRQISVPGGATLPFSLAVKADGLIYVAGTLAQEGDIKAQTKTVLDNIGQTLTKSGSSLANVVVAHVYVKNAADAAGMTEVWRTVWPKDAPTRTTVVGQLVSPNALVEISAIAVPTGAERVIVTPPGWSTANPYSYAIRTGDTLFTSGVVARNTSDNVPMEGDMATQTKAVMDTAGQLLKAAGFGFEHVVSSRVYINDVAGFQDMNRSYTPAFPKDPPARATVVTGLPGPTYKVEIALTAHRGAKQAFTTPAADGTPGKPSATLSSAIKVGNRLYLSGILGNNAQNKGDMKAQASEALVRIGRTLTAAGFSWTDVADGIVYITDISQFAAMNEAYRSVFGKEFPARATVGTGLVGADGLVEIMFVASK